MSDPIDLRDYYNHETRISLLEAGLGNIHETLLRFEKRFDQIDSKFEHMEVKFDNKFEQLENKLGQLETKVDGKFEILETKVDGKFEGMEKKIEDLTKECRSDFRWLMTFMISGFVGLFGIIAHTQHWML